MTSALDYWLLNFNPDGSRRPAQGTDTRTKAQIYGGGAIASAPAISAAPASGQLPPPAQEAAAAGNSPLQVTQAAMVIGEPIPVVFARRRGTVGGVLTFPKATEASFSNTSTTISSRYHMVLGEAPMGSVQVRDVRCGECRIGTFSQNTSKRAGTWAPGNTATAQSGYTVPTFSTFTGGGGGYAGLATFEAGATFPGGSDDWRTGWNVFVRDGLIIERGRLLDGAVGASDNIADLVLWAWQKSSRVPSAMIDISSLAAAATFVEANGLWCNGEFQDSANLGDWLVGILPFFLLRETRVGGKYGLRPLLPTNSDGTISTDPVIPRWLLSESIVKPDSFQATDTDASVRRSPILNMIWRQHYDDTDVPVVRTLPIGSANNSDKPEQRDLSQFCTSELHAARAGAYEYARRLLVTHTATIKLRPGTQTGRVQEGDLVQLYLKIEADGEAPWFYNYYYQVETVGTDYTGEEVLTLTHFPVDSTGRSLIAQAVMAVSESGVVLPSQKTGGSCDLVGRSTDTSVPASTTSGTAFSSTSTGLVDPFGGGGGGGGVPQDGPPEPTPGSPGVPAVPQPAAPIGGPGSGDTLCPTSGTEYWIIRISGVGYEGFNTFASYVVTYNTMSNGAPSLVERSQLNAGTIKPDRIKLQYDSTDITVTKEPSGTYSLTNIYTTDRLLVGRFQAYNDPIYGGGLLWDFVYEVKVERLGYKCLGSNSPVYHPTPVLLKTYS
jgi:hypothetical protein